VRYNVHIFAVVRVSVPGIEADSQEDACRKAVEDTDLYEAVKWADTEYAEDITEYLVDVEGDTEYQHSRWYKDKNIFKDEGEDVE